MNNQYLQTKFQEKFKKLDLIVGNHFLTIIRQK